MVFEGCPYRTFRCFNSDIFLLYIFSKRSFISRKSEGKSTSTFSNSSSWRYGLTSGDSRVLISTASTPKFLQTSWIVFLSPPGDAVRARTLLLSACVLYFCVMKL